jgi:TolB protein
MKIKIEHNKMRLKIIFYFCLVLIFLRLGCDDDTIIIIPPPPPPSGTKIIDYLPAWSPDGHTIAYFHNEIPMGIYLIDSNGTNKRLLIENCIGMPDFSPDGNWVTFNCGQIYKIKINGDSLTQITNGGNNRFPSWSPNGEWISYDSDFNDPHGAYYTWIIKPDGTGARRIGGVVYADWYSNSVFLLGIGLYDEFYRVNINDTIKVKLTNLAQINPDYFDNGYLKISPNDSKIIFSCQHKRAINFQIFSMNFDGSNIIRLTSTQGYSPAWSPDGEKIVYCDSSPDNGRLWIMNKDGTNKRQLTFP